MGLRGPGARPVRKKAETAPAGEKSPSAWTLPGLSRAERVIAFIETLKITSGKLAGSNLRVRPWQREFIEAVYATDAAGQRMVRTALLTLPRKNGKSGLVAALALAHLVGPEAEQRGQVFSAAADRNQSGLIFNEMKAMILADPDIAERCVIRDFNKHIEDVETGSTYSALSADAKSKHGFSASTIIYDELAQAPDRQLWDVLTTSTAARAEPITFVISTQSSDPTHIMSELVDYGAQVRAGVVEDPTFHATIYAAPEDADVWDEAVWFACNPALGDFRSLEEMRAYAAQAKRIPARESTFRALYLNQRVDADTRFITGADWMPLATEIDPEALRGRPCWAGLDLSSTSDLTAAVLYFPDDGGIILPFFWIPGHDLEGREERDRVPYRLWRDQGYLEAPHGRAIDKKSVAGRLAELASTYEIQGIAFDRWRMKDLMQLLDSEGIALPLIDWGQGFASMGPAIDAFETKLLNGELRHGNHPVLNWNMSNAVVVQDPAGLRKLDKSRARARIDGAQALMMAIGLASRTAAKPVLDFSDMVILA